MTTFLYVSPHFDDAVLSCGGLLLRHAARGESATVLTVCAGEPDYSNLSEFAQAQHRQWGSPRDPIAVRRTEDAEALRRLGARAAYLDVQDCIYRRDRRGQPVVTTRRALFGAVHPDDRPLVGCIAAGIRAHAVHREQSLLVGPLAAGRHVDHQLVRDALRSLASAGYHVVWYEDFPYAQAPGAVARSRRVLGTLRWHSVIYPIDVRQKIEAIAAYRTQLKSTFRGKRDMAARVRAYGRTVGGGTGHAERLWEMGSGELKSCAHSLPSN